MKKHAFDKKDLSFSVMLVPHKGSRIRTIRISHRNTIRFLWAAGFVFLLVCGFVARFGYLNQQLAKHQESLVKIQALAKENNEQKTELALLNSQAEEMQQKLDSLNSLAGRISALLKITPTAVSRGLTYSGTKTNFSGLAEQADQQQEVLNSFLPEAENYSEYLSHRPSIMPANGRITSLYGNRRNPTGRGYEFHDGIDIEAKYGDPVVASGDGVVSFAGWHAGYGYKVEIDHGYGIKTFYAHNSRLKVSAGQKVKTGDVIALAGSSGRSTGVHVHWGATQAGRSVNPLDFIR